MMTPVKIFLSSLFLITLATAPKLVGALPSPPPLRATSLVERQENTPYTPMVQVGSVATASLYVCEDVFWAGKCAIHTYPLGSGECAQLDGRTSAVGPDEGYSCTFYKNAVCRDLTGSDSISMVHPGVSNLIASPKGDFNDAILSYQCFAK